MAAEASWYIALLNALVSNDAEEDVTALEASSRIWPRFIHAGDTKSAFCEFYYDQRARLCGSPKLPCVRATLRRRVQPGAVILANALLFTDHYQDAASLFDQARVEYLALDMPLEAARLSVGQIWALAYLGDFDRALMLAEEVTPLLAASDDPDDRQRLRGVYNNLGILYDLVGQYEEALAAYDHKLALLEPGSMTLEHVRTQHNRGCVLTCLNAFDEALAAFQLAETGFRAAEAWADVARLLLNRALLLALWQRYAEAEAALKRPKKH